MAEDKIMLSKWKHQIFRIVIRLTLICGSGGCITHEKKKEDDIALKCAC